MNSASNAAQLEANKYQSTRDAAREYIRRGWAVIDVPRRSKAPTRARWQHAQLTPDDIEPAGNVGLLLGKPSSGLRDVDLDAAEAIAAAPYLLPPTDMRHGRASKPLSHWWYVADDTGTVRHQDPDGSTLIELRGSGGQTIVPPSVHPTGEPVEWAASGEPARVEAATLRRTVATVAAVALLARRWPATGSRHDAAMALSGLLLRGGMDLHDVERLIEVAARVAGDDEWCDRTRAARDTAAAIEAGGAATGGPRLADLLPDGPAVVTKLRDWLGLTAPAETGGIVVRVATLSDFLALQLPLRETILAPWLPTQGLVMIYAERGMGKTFFALYAAYAAATGTAFLRFAAAKPWRVLYIDGEMPGVVLQERLSRIVSATPAEPPSPDHFRLITPDLQPGAMIDLAQLDSQSALASLVDTADLILADNISTLCGGNENESEDWRPVAAWGLMLRRAGKSLVLIHHAGKNGEQRGISKREDILDSVIVLKRPRDYQPEQGARFEVHFKKHRGFYGDDAKPFEARLGTDDTGAQVWTMRTLDDCRTERIITLHRDGQSQRDIAKALEVGIGTVNRHLQKAKREGLL